MLQALLFCLGAYLMGSIPFGLILGKCFGIGDIRTIGSGNIGATNMLRTGHKGVAALTLLLDGAKGTMAVLLAREITPDLMVLGGVCAVLGHIFPVWLRFRGGKGVATTLGVMFGIHWALGASFVALWIAVFILSRLSALAGMIAVGTMPLLVYLASNMTDAILLLCLAILVFSRHRDNITRMISGRELSFRRPSEEQR